MAKKPQEPDLTYEDIVKLLQEEMDLENEDEDEEFTDLDFNN